MATDECAAVASTRSLLFDRAVCLQRKCGCRGLSPPRNIHPFCPPPQRSRPTRGTCASPLQGADVTDAVFEDALIGFEDAKKLCANPTLVGESRAGVGCRSERR